MRPERKQSKIGGVYRWQESPYAVDLGDVRSKDGQKICRPGRENTELYGPTVCWRNVVENVHDGGSQERVAWSLLLIDMRSVCSGISLPTSYLIIALLFSSLALPL